MFTEPKWANLLWNAFWCRVCFSFVYFHFLGLSLVFTLRANAYKMKIMTRSHALRAAHHAQIQIQMHNFSLASPIWLTFRIFFFGVSSLGTATYALTQKQWNREMAEELLLYRVQFNRNIDAYKSKKKKTVCDGCCDCDSKQLFLWHREYYYLNGTNARQSNISKENVSYQRINACNAIGMWTFDCSICCFSHSIDNFKWSFADLDQTIVFTITYNHWPEDIDHQN